MLMTLDVSYLSKSGWSMICIAMVGTPPISEMRSRSMISSARPRVEVVHHDDLRSGGGTRHQDGETPRRVEERNVEKSRAL